MAKGFTYICGDEHGNVYTRYCAKHTAPKYEFAVIRRLPAEDDGRPVSMPAISYHANVDAAEAERNRFLDGFGADLGYFVSVVEVDAKPGRLNV